MTRRRLGWLGPVIVLVGAAVAALGVWYMVTARPKPGAVIDTIAIGDDRALVVRAEADSERNFIELREGKRTLWQALVPPYAGRPGAPGLAWNDVAVSVRVIRNGRPEVFAIAMTNGSKLGGFRLAPGKTAVRKATAGPVTLTDHERSYEIVSGDGWNELVAIDLGTGQARWRQDLGPGLIEAGGIDGNLVWLRQRGQRREFAKHDGKEIVQVAPQ